MQKCPYFFRGLPSPHPCILLSVQKLVTTGLIALEQCVVCEETSTVSFTVLQLKQKQLEPVNVSVSDL